MDFKNFISVFLFIPEIRKKLPPTFNIEQNVPFVLTNLKHRKRMLISTSKLSKIQPPVSKMRKITAVNFKLNKMSPLAFKWKINGLFVFINLRVIVQNIYGFKN